MSGLWAWLRCQATRRLRRVTGYARPFWALWTAAEYAEHDAAMARCINPSPCPDEVDAPERIGDVIWDEWGRRA